MRIPKLPKASKSYKHSKSAYLNGWSAPMVISLVAIVRVIPAIITIPFPLIGWVLSIIADELDYPILYAAGFHYDNYQKIDKFFDQVQYLALLIALLISPVPTQILIAATILYFSRLLITPLAEFSRIKLLYLLIPNMFEFFAASYFILEALGQDAMIILSPAFLICLYV
ncbi:MAG: hypothetical protein ACOCXP_02335, partial [Candidatus Dojkabacteria bacterium]